MFEHNFASELERTKAHTFPTFEAWAASRDRLGTHYLGLDAKAGGRSWLRRMWEATHARADVGGVYLCKALALPRAFELGDLFETMTLAKERPGLGWVFVSLTRCDGLSAIPRHYGGTRTTRPDGNGGFIRCIGGGAEYRSVWAKPSKAVLDYWGVSMTDTPEDREWGLSSVELIQRTDGVLAVACSANSIAHRWLALLKPFTLEAFESFFSDAERAAMQTERERAAAAWGHLSPDVHARPLLSFNVTGEDRQTGALGVCEPFSITVRAVDSAEAREKAIQARTDAGREHVLCKSVEKAPDPAPAASPDPKTVKRGDVLRIGGEALRVLSRAEADADSVRLPLGQLPRPLYVEVAKALELAGGKWNRGRQAFLFKDGGASDALESMILTGEIADKKAALQAFYTPADLARRVVELADVKDCRTLEPSAGGGALAIAAREAGGHVVCHELDGTAADKLASLGFPVVRGDFLAATPSPEFHRVAMNPPFRGQADIAHVRHAFEFLRPGGRLVAIMSASVRFRANAKGYEFRQWVESLGGVFEDIPAGAFAESGTDVATVILTINKPEA